MIQKHTNSFKSKDLDIFYDIYIPNNQNGILVQILHGMVEHRGKYEFIAQNLAQNGFIVAINDHRGHGDSIGGEIYLGEMGKNGFEEALNDAHILSKILQNKFNPKKFILIGHSMGSLIARRYLQEFEQELDLLILCGTPSPVKMLDFGIFILRVCKFFRLNNIGRSMANKLSFISFNAKYKKIDKLDNGKPSGVFWINRDEDILIKHINDKKCRFIFTIKSFINLLNGMKKVFSQYHKTINNPTLPILFISGEDDACGEFGKGALKAFKHLKMQGYNNTKLILYANARHELFLELNKDEVLDDVLHFVKLNLKC